jgi:hypothetical protein
MNSSRIPNTFGSIDFGRTFTKDALRWIKVSATMAYQLNGCGVAVPSLKRKFFPETTVVEVR